MKSQTLKLNTQKIFWTLAIVLVALALLYGYLVKATIMNVAARQTAQADMIKLASDTSNLEASYITLRNEITLENAYALGFKDIISTKFLARKADTTGLSLNSTQ